MTARIRLFLSSYVPLFVVGAIRFETTGLQVFLGLAAVAGTLSLVSLIHVSRNRIEPRVAAATSVRDLGSEVAAYVATYLLPFVTVDQPDTTDLVAYAIVFLTLGVVFVNSDLVGVNPLLYLLGYRVWAVSGVRKLVQGADVDTIVISRDTVVAGSDITLTDLATGVSLALPPNEGTP